LKNGINVLLDTFKLFLKIRKVGSNKKDTKKIF